MAKAKVKITEAQILRDLKEKPTVPIDPHVAWAFGCSRNKAYAMAQEGGDCFLRIEPGGKRPDGEDKERPMLRGISAAIRRKVGIE